MIEIINPIQLNHRFDLTLVVPIITERSKLNMKINKIFETITHVLTNSLNHYL